MTASQIQGYARRPVRAVDATPDRHHRGTTGDRSNRGGEEAGRSHSTTAPNSALCMPRVLDVEVIHEASRTNDSDTPSAVRQVRAYAVVTAVGNQRPASVRQHELNEAITASSDAVMSRIDREKKGAQSSPLSEKLVTLSPTIR